MLSLISMLAVAWATHVTTYDVNVGWTKAPFSGMESLTVEPAEYIQGLRPARGPLPPLAEAYTNLAARGEHALVFTNPMSSWAQMKINGQAVGTIGPFATARLEGVRFGAYVIELQVPTLRERTFAVQVLTAERTAPPLAVRVSRQRIDLSDNIYFELDSSVIRAESFGLLAEVAKALLAHAELRVVRVEGHTDSQGEAAYNQTLSESRASAVREFLVAAGVAPERLTSGGAGESQLVDPTDSDEAHERNRRVEFLVTELVEEPAPAPVPAPKKKKGK